MLSNIKPYSKNQILTMNVINDRDEEFLKNN